MRAREFIIEYKNYHTQDYEGLKISMYEKNGQLVVKALDDWGVNELGYVIFNIGDNDELDPQDLRVEEKYQGQGIAKVMYDFVTSHGYEIHRSPDQTPDGKHFWDKNRGEEVNVWEGRENYNGINMLLQSDEDEVYVKASAGPRELGHVLFVIDGEYLLPQDLEVEPQYRGYNIARKMYDFVKSKGYKIRRSGNQTRDGSKFWDKNRPEQNVWEDTNAPQVLYHATYHPLLKSIKQHGLGGDKAQAKWEDSKPGVVYLATDPNVAESYAESSDVVPDEWLDQIVVLKINASQLDQSKLKLDRNVIDNEGDTLEYHGVIPVNLLS